MTDSVNIWKREVQMLQGHWELVEWHTVRLAQGAVGGIVGSDRWHVARKGARQVSFGLEAGRGVEQTMCSVREHI